MALAAGGGTMAKGLLPDLTALIPGTTRLQEKCWPQSGRQWTSTNSPLPLAGVGDQTPGFSGTKVARGVSKSESLGPFPRPKTKNQGVHSTVRYPSQDLCHLILHTPPTFLLSQKGSKQRVSLPSGLWVDPANRELRQKSRGEEEREALYSLHPSLQAKVPFPSGIALPSPLCVHLQ